MEYTPDKLNQAIAELIRAYDAFYPAYETFQKALQVVMNELVKFYLEVIEPALQAVWEAWKRVVVCIRRGRLYIDIRRYMPAGVARWIARHWPKRWLPRLGPDLVDFIFALAGYKVIYG